MQLSDAMWPVFLFAIVDKATADLSWAFPAPPSAIASCRPLTHLCPPGAPLLALVDHSLHLCRISPPKCPIVSAAPGKENGDWARSLGLFSRPGHARINKASRSKWAKLANPARLLHQLHSPLSV